MDTYNISSFSFCPDKHHFILSVSFQLNNATNSRTEGHFTMTYSMNNNNKTTKEITFFSSYCMHVPTLKLPDIFVVILSSSLYLSLFLSHLLLFYFISLANLLMYALFSFTHSLTLALAFAP